MEPTSALMQKNPQKFYDEFAELHERLVSLSSRRSRELPFYKQLIQDFQLRNVLDLACGTGHHAIFFTELGLLVDAMDLSDSMLKMAKENASMAGLSIGFKKGDFRTFTQYYPGTYDAIICLGNSLPYLKEKNEIQKLICDIANHLNNSGLCILEFRNYDYLMAQKPRFFPLSLKENSGFIYVLDYLDNEIVFNLLYLDLKTEELKTFETTYYPLLYGDIKEYLKQAGLKIIQQWENYSKSPFDVVNSPRLLLIAQKEK